MDSGLEWEQIPDEAYALVREAEWDGRQLFEFLPLHPLFRLLATQSALDYVQCYCLFAFTLILNLKKALL